jgi:hypothetical protein
MVLERVVIHLAAVDVAPLHARRSPLALLGRRRWRGIAGGATLRMRGACELLVGAEDLTFVVLGRCLRGGTIDKGTASAATVERAELLPRVGGACAVRPVRAGFLDTMDTSAHLAGSRCKEASGRVCTRERDSDASPAGT